MTEREHAAGGPHPNPLPQERGPDPALPQTFLILDPDEHTLDRSRCVVLPVPYEETTSYRKGTRRGPEAIIRASAEMEDYDLELGCEPCSVGIHTAPALEPAPVLESNGGPEAMAGRVREAVAGYAAQGKFVGMLGGEHSITSGAVTAFAERHPGLSVLIFDAQADLRDEYQGWTHSHACAARRALDHAASLTLVGVRSMTGEEAAFAKEHDVALFPRGPEPIEDVDAIVDTLNEAVYVSFDLDAFDPSFMAAVGTPEPGGMEWWEALRILRAVSERRRIVGFDVVELAPDEGPEACAYTAAKLVYKLFGYATAHLSC
ncbi:MAG: agmatinase [Chloroflexota bacterium]|nr:agmatinase [Chloroflexota bacterium]MDE2884752.1 agmatinase [Chloroflexota bacterium]